MTEESNNDNDSVEERRVIFEEIVDIDWANLTLDEMESVNRMACNFLNEQGYNGGELFAKVNRRPKSLENRLPKDAPLEQRVKEIVRGGISLSSLFYTVGPQCLSADEIFIAFEYRERLKLYEAEKKERAVIDKKKKLEDGAKALLALQKETYLKGELQTLLHWKLGPERYAEHSKKSARDLDALWQIHKNDPNPPDLLIPPVLEEPPVPSIEETELGRAKQHQFEVALRTAANYNNEQLEQLAQVITGLCEMRNVSAASGEV